eukprot:1929027-Amphidinium_carterae.2
MFVPRRDKPVGYRGEMVSICAHTHTHTYTRSSSHCFSAICLEAKPQRLLARDRMDRSRGVGSPSLAIESEIAPKTLEDSAGNCAAGEQENQ